MIATGATLVEVASCQTNLNPPNIRYWWLKQNYFLLCFDFEKIQQDNRRFESPLLPNKFCSATHLISTSIEKEIQALCQTLRCQRQVEQIDFVVALSFQGNKNGEISSINAFDVNHYKSSWLLVSEETRKKQSIGKEIWAGNCWSYFDSNEMNSRIRQSFTSQIKLDFMGDLENH